MNQAQFIIQAKNWLFHKMLLAKKSKAFEEDKQKKAAILKTGDVFYNFLRYPNNYSVGQIALLIKRHESLLETILPIPANPSYETSLAMLQKLVAFAEQFLTQHNLHL